MDANEQLPELKQDRAERTSRFYTRLHRWQLQARRLWWVPAGCLAIATGFGGDLDYAPATGVYFQRPNDSEFPSPEHGGSELY